MATGGSSLCAGSDDLDLYCDICQQQKKTSTAVSYCQECQEALCKHCENVHRNQKVSQTHNLLTGDQMVTASVSDKLSASLMTCNKHTMTIKYLCMSDNKVCCEKCKATSHKTCALVDIGKHVRQHKPTRDLKTTQNRLEELEISFNAIKDNKAKEKVSVRTGFKNCIKQVKELREDLNSQLDKLEQNMITELEKIENKLNQNLDDHMTMISDAIKQIQDNLTTIDQCQQTTQPEVTFVCLNKMEDSIEECEDIYGTLGSQSDEVEIKFIPDKLLVTALTELKSFGEIEVTREADSVVSIVDMTVSDIKHHNVGCEYVQSVVFMPSGHVVLACANGGLKLLDKDFKQLSQLSLGAVCACRVSDTEVLVSQGNKKQIQFVQVLPTMVAKNVLIIGKLSRGVCYHNGEIYVACGDKNPGNGEIRIVDRQGRVLRRLGFHDVKYMFTKPWDVKVNNAGDKVFVTDGGNDSITCMDQRGTVLFRFTNKDMKNPLGMLVDRQDNVLVTADGSDKVLVIHQDGRKLKVLLSKKDGIINPFCVSLRQSDGCLAVGTYHGSTLVRFIASTERVAAAGNFRCDLIPRI